MIRKTALLLVAVILLATCSSCGPSVDMPETPDGFTFSLTWDCYGVSSYDSATGKLVKTNDTTRPKDYITTYVMSGQEIAQVYEMIRELDVMSYPDTYNPHKNGLASEPPMTLILTVHTDTFDKTIKAENIAIGYETGNSKGQKFLSTCKAIRDILISTEEWKALPDYEFYYD